MSAKPADYPPIVDSLAALRAGLSAVREVRGLFTRVLLFLFLNFFCSLAIWLGFAYFAFKWVFYPGLAWFKQLLPAWLHFTGDILFWIIAALTLAVFLVVAYRLSFMILEWGFDILVERIVDHFRGPYLRPFRLGTFLYELWLSLRNALRDLFFALLVMPFGWIPIIGIAVVFTAGSTLLGRAISEPYRSVLAARDEELKLPENRLWSAFALGYFPMSLTMIPVLGGLILPWLHLFITLGFAYTREKIRIPVNLPPLPG